MHAIVIPNENRGVPASIEIRLNQIKSISFFQQSYFDTIDCILQGRQNQRHSL